MNKSLVIKSIIAMLIVVMFAICAVGCFDDQGDVLVDKAALNAELALEVTEQGDYTLDSYNAYLTKLEAARKVANDDAATQDDVDKATADLSAARLALVVRPVKEIMGASKTFKMAPGDSREISIGDYIDTDGLSKITYKVKTSNAVVALSPITEGKFTMTAGAVRKTTDLTVSIIVYYDGVEAYRVDLAVEITDEVPPSLVANEVVREYDMLTLGNKDSIVIDFSENVNNYKNSTLTYSVKCGEEEIALDGTTYTFVLGSYTEEYAYTTFTVTVSYEFNGETNTLEYTYKLGLRDAGKYSIANGNFENGLEGWTIINTFGEAPFGGIDDKTRYWVQEFPMFNVGKYFSAYADGASEESQGTLASPYFVAHGDYATYMLGGAGNPNVYITIEDKDGKVLGLYRNTKFADLPPEVTDFNAQRELVGNTVFLANFVTYKVSIAEFEGMEIRFVVHDYASSNWGVVFFDELVTYYSPSENLPENAVLAENLLANRAALEEELALEVAEQGDYTLDSYNAYLAKLAEAKELLNNVTATQETVDNAVAALKEARLALATRPINEIAGANKSFNLISGKSKEITLADYIDTNGLSGITYELKSSSAHVILSDIVDGKFTITAGNTNETVNEKVSIIVCHNGSEKLTVELSVVVTNDLAPTLIDNEIVKVYDMFVLTNKQSIELDFSQNVDNAGELKLTYSAKLNGTDIKLNGTKYTFAFGAYTDEVKYETFTVTVSYEANGEKQSISYTYKLGLMDTTSYRISNGGFESGMEGWTLVGNIGGISSDRNYWVGDPESAEGFAFGMDGDKMFSAYAPGAEERLVGTLTSSTFKIGGSGFVTFKVGAMRDGNYVYVDVVDANTKEILARYYNGLWAERTDDKKSGCTLIAYKADLSAFMGKEVFFRISDNADSGYGLFFVDSFVTYYENEPEGFNNATPVSYTVTGTIYDLFNGGFEMGDVQGWWNIGEPGKVTGANAFFNGREYGKNGDFLYSGVQDLDGIFLEGNRGVLTSSAFEIGGTGYITFMLGGGENVLCYVQVIDAVTGEILARYHQQEMDEAVLKTYVADLSAYIGRTARIQLIDQAENAWGCVSFDNVVTYHTSKPAGIEAIDIKGNIKYTIDNGSFESGNIDGWTMNITEEGAHNTLGWVMDTEIDREWYAKNDETKDGNFLFTFVTPDDVNCENTKGTLQSSTFSLKQGAFVSFKFGGAGNGINHDVYIELCRADGSVIARFYNDAEGKVNTKMNSYYYQYNGAPVECFFRVVDNSTGGYGCFVVDDFRVNLVSAPEGFIPAIQ